MSLVQETSEPGLGSPEGRVVQNGVMLRKRCSPGISHPRYFLIL